MKYDSVTQASLLFDILWFTSLSILVVLPFVYPNVVQNSAGSLAVLGFLGITMILSNRIRGISLAGKMLYWTAINIFKPRYKYNHLIWGFFIVGIGVLSVLAGDELNRNDIQFFGKVHSSYEFWIGISAVLIFNILVGIYAVRKYEKR
jgi:uncharacterized membrane protein